MKYDVSIMISNIYKKYNQFMLKKLLIRGLNLQEAEDALQEAFVTIIKSPTLNVEKGLISYVTVYAPKIAYEKYRRSLKHKHQVRDFDCTNNSTPETAYATKQDLLVLDELIRNLPKKQAESITNVLEHNVKQDTNYYQGKSSLQNSKRAKSKLNGSYEQQIVKVYQNLTDK